MKQEDILEAGEVCSVGGVRMKELCLNYRKGGIYGDY